MMALLAKALLAGILVALISWIGQKQPTMGALIAALPLVSVLGMIFLWTAKPDSDNMALHMEATFWYVLPSLPMFLLMPWALRQGWDFVPVLIGGCALTITLYLLLSLAAPRLGIPI